MTTSSSDHGLLWVGDQLATTSEKVLARARKRKQSASTTNRILQCPAKHLASAAIREELGPLDPAPLGNASHDVLEAFYTLPPVDRTRDRIPYLVESVEERYASTLVGSDMDRWRTQVTNAAAGIFALEDPTTIDVVALEYDVDGVELAPGLPFVGFVDRIRRDADGGLVVEDYKSGKFKSPSKFGDDYGDQVRAYAIAIEAVLGEPVTQGKLLFTAAQRPRSVDLAPSKRAGTVNRYRSARDLLDESYAAGRYATRPGPLCGWCPLARSCPVASIRTDKARAVAETKELVDIPEQDGTYRALAGCDLSDTGGDPPTTEATMSISIPDVMPASPTPENRPYEEFVGNGDLNLASYAAGAVASVAVFAVRYVTQARDGGNEWLAQRSTAQQRAAINSAVAHIVATTIFRAQSRIGGSTSWQSTTNKHLRMFVYDAFNRVPFPFGNEPAVAPYLAGVEEYAVATMRTALRLHADTTTTYDQGALTALTH